RRRAVRGWGVGRGIAASVSRSRFIAAQSRDVQALTLGPKKNWIDARARGPVTYVDTGQLNWETAWQSRFWNKKVERADGYLGAHVLGMPVRPVGPLADGRIVGPDGREGRADYALAPADLLLAGKPVGHLAQGLVLWKLAQPFRARSWLSGVASGGTAGGKAELQVYACRGGTFKGELTSSPSRTIAVSLNDLPYVKIP